MLLGAVLGVSGTGQAAEEKDAPGPREVAKVFYGELRRLGVTGLPNGSDWEVLKVRVSEELAAAVVRAQKEQAEFIKANPCEKPPWIEGDLFSSLFEGPQKFEIGEAKVEGDKAEVPVGCVHSSGGDTAKWTDTLLLVKTGEGWRIDDVRYGGKWDFALTGTLKEGLAPEGN